MPCVGCREMNCAMFRVSRLLRDTLRPFDMPLRASLPLLFVVASCAIVPHVSRLFIGGVTAHIPAELHRALRKHHLCLYVLASCCMTQVTGDAAGRDLDPHYAVRTFGHSRTGCRDRPCLKGKKSMLAAYTENISPLLERWAIPSGAQSQRSQCQQQ